MDFGRRLIAKELALFEEKFAESVRGSNPVFDRILRLIIKRKGKQMRPMFIFLSALIAGGITEKTYRAASLIELLHTATLVHDDVVDSSMVRRSFFSINALWKNKIAVLVGDYLLSKGLLLSLANNDVDILKITSRAVKEMTSRRKFILTSYALKLHLFYRLLVRQVRIRLQKMKRRPSKSGYLVKKLVLLFKSRTTYLTMVRGT
jgi:hypothetical protein